MFIIFFVKTLDNGQKTLYNNITKKKEVKMK